MPEEVRLAGHTAVVAAGAAVAWAMGRCSRDPVQRWLVRAAWCCWGLAAYALSAMWLTWAGCYPAWLYPLFKE